MGNLAKLQEEMEGYCGLAMYDEALRVLDSIRTKGQEEVTLSFLRTRILRAAGRYAEMRQTAEKRKERCPNEPEAWVSLADAMRQSGSIQQGRTVLQEAEKSSRKIPISSFSSGATTAFCGSWTRPAPMSRPRSPSTAPGPKPPNLTRIWLPCAKSLKLGTWAQEPFAKSSLD